MQIKDVIAFLEKIAPPNLQEHYDNAGLITGNAHDEVTGVLVCLDSTEAVIDEAISLRCNLVIAHHPIIFSGLKQITGRTYIERTIIKAIKNDIAIYAIHTNLDNMLVSGVNGKIAEKLQLINIEVLLPKTPDEDKNIGAGVIGDLGSPIAEKDFLLYLKKEMQTDCIRHTAFLNKKISKVAVCGGSGSFLLSAAKTRGADIFITGDFKYHEFFDAQNEILIADIGHFESEQFTIELLFDIISQNFHTFATRFTKVRTNPVLYL